MLVIQAPQRERQEDFEFKARPDKSDTSHYLKNKMQNTRADGMAQVTRVLV
jgi:hypothetical protein